jgi:hypothetical protein
MKFRITSRLRFVHSASTGCWVFWRNMCKSESRYYGMYSI